MFAIGPDTSFGSGSLFLEYTVLSYEASQPNLQISPYVARLPTWKPGSYPGLHSPLVNVIKVNDLVAALIVCLLNMWHQGILRTTHTPRET